MVHTEDDGDTKHVIYLTWCFGKIMSLCTFDHYEYQVNRV